MRNNVLKSLSHEDLYKLGKAIIGSKKLGFVLYRDKVIYANDYICELFGYKREELGGMSVVDFAHESIRDKFRNIIGNRLQGEIGQRYFSNVMCIRKDGRYLFVNYVADTIMFEGKPTGFLILTDATSEKELSMFYSVLKDINHLITESIDLSSLLEGVCSTVVDKYAAKVVFVGRLKKNGELKPICLKGEEGNYFNEIISSGLINKEPSYVALREGKIKIAVNIDGSQILDESIKTLLKKHDIRSACFIPLKKNGKTQYVLSVYVKDYNFVEEYADVMKELQNDLSFALDRTDETQRGITFYEAAKSSDWWFLITDIDGNILFVNETVEEISSYKREELIGQNPRIFKSGLHNQKFYEELWGKLLKGEIVDVVIANRRKDGTIFHIQDKIIPVELPGGIKRFVAIGRDITKEMELEKEAQRLKVEDALTGLLNLNGFIYTVKGKLRKVDTGALVLVDIVNFSYINRVFGFNVGDKFLKKIAERLRKQFPNIGCVSRIGSDDFALFVDSSIAKNPIASLSVMLLEMFEDPFKVDGKEITVSFNAGIVMYPFDAKNIKELMERASITLNRAKDKGENIALFYNPVADENIEKYVHAENLVSKAVRESLFFLNYQPYFDAWNCNIYGAESLIRIKDGNGIIHYPDEFIDYLESSKYLGNFERWLLKEVGDNVVKWKKHITINISASSFKDSEFIGLIADYSNKTEGYLGIEITERTLMSDMKESREVINKLKSIKSPPMISIDDFGTGYASLSMLQEFPIDVIKIDMSFVRDIHLNKKNIAIVQTIIQLAKSLGIKTIAEGVEKEEEYKTLRTMGADYIQGYYFAKPMSSEMFEKKIKI